MKFIAFASALLIASALLSCSSSKKIADEQPPSQFKGTTNKSITVDGNDNDWQGLPTATSPLYTFTYSVARDEKELYLLMKIDNPLEQTKFLRGGMELWIDPANAKSKTTEVIFPVKGELSEAAMQPQTASSDAKMNREMIHLNIKAALVSLGREGFKPEYSGVQTVSQPTGFKSVINWTGENELVYELSIPLQAFAQPLSNNFELGFFLGNIERPTDASQNRGEGNSGWNGSMGGGRHGGGGHTGGSGFNQRQSKTSNAANQGNNTDWRKLSEKESFWVQCSW